jgi:tetratricopeptide (TPR) repeat protein
MSDLRMDIVMASVIEASSTLEPVSHLLEKSPEEIKRGDRTKAEAFVANAPSLYAPDLDVDSVGLVLDVAVSAIEADPTYGGGYALAAGCLLQLAGCGDDGTDDKRALAAALPWAFHATRVDPENPEGWEVYTRLHCCLGDFASAQAALGMVYRRFGNTGLYARLAFLYFLHRNEVKQALTWGARAWQMETDSQRLVWFLERLAELYRRGGKLVQALDAWRVITERNSGYALAHHRAAECAFQVGDLEAAIDFNTRALELEAAPEFEDLRLRLRKATGRRPKARRNATGKITGRVKGKASGPIPKGASSRRPAVPAPETAVVTPPPVRKKFDTDSVRLPNVRKPSQRNPAVPPVQRRNTH